MKKHASRNRVYRLVWDRLRNAWVAVAEATRGCGKGSGRSLVAVAALSLLGNAHAAPAGGELAAGTGSIAQTGVVTTVTQASPTLSINWKSFDVGAHETVNFVQPSATAIAINRIFDVNGTKIFGHLNANGQVYLINPNGILFGKGARVDVGALVATTLEPDAVGANADTRSFRGDGPGSIVNLGTLQAASGGHVVLLGNRVVNEGVISARLGTVALGAGSAATLTFDGASLVRMRVDNSALASLAQNGGLIRADGGQVFMTAGARDSLLASVVNNTGVIEARTVENRAGTIVLLGSMAAGTVEVGGRLDASAPSGGDGGFIETSAAHVKVGADVVVTTQAPAGRSGTWLIDPQNYTVAASGGDITGAALSTSLGTTNVELQSSAGGTVGSGNVNVNDAVTWSSNNTLTLTASNDVNVNADITATGNAAGLVIRANTVNGPEAASGPGIFNLLRGAAITLSGSAPTLSIAGASYTVINRLGLAGSVTGTDLQGMNGNVAGRYALGSDIDATATAGWNAGAGFVPIGTGGPAFSGRFDGLGHTIGGLFINTPANSVVGLFGHTNGALLRNVGLVDANITGSDYVGALAGQQTSGAISDSYSTGTVRGDSYVGGLVGYGVSGLTNTWSAAAVSGTGVGIGGLIGLADAAGPITNSYATGPVTGLNYVGGLAGLSYVALTNTYATGSVAGGSFVGGLVGLSFGNIATSYAAGAVSGAGSTGGLVGSNSGTVSNSYWNTTRSGQATSAGGTGLTEAQMSSAASFTGFNFTSTPGASGNNWVIVDADGSLNNAAAAAGATMPMLSSEYSTRITNAHQLQLVAMAPAVGHSLGRDVNAARTGLVGGVATDVWGSAGFVPIGSLATPFTATFDGAGHTVSGLTTVLGTPNVGLFGVTAGAATIRGVGLVGGSVTGGAGTGGLVGNNGPGVAIIDNFNTGSVSGAAGTGGLVGSNTTGAISSSHATGSVVGAAGTGGLLGSNTTGPVSDSYATGSVSGAAGTGGLIGSTTTGAISGSYATGSVGGAAGTGGLIGSNTSGSVSGSYATGNVVGAAGTGGLIGSSTSGPISTSYATGNVDGGLAASIGGLIGSNTSGTVSDSYAAGGVTGTGASRGGVDRQQQRRRGQQQLLGQDDFDRAELGRRGRRHDHRADEGATQLHVADGGQQPRFAGLGFRRHLDDVRGVDLSPVERLPDADHGDRERRDQDLRTGQPGIRRELLDLPERQRAGHGELQRHRPDRDQRGQLRDHTGRAVFEPAGIRHLLC